jgi:NAD+ diphosphatase
MKEIPVDHLAQSTRNCFGHPVLDRKSEFRKDKAWIQEQLFNSKTLFVPVWRNKNFFSKNESQQPVFLDWTAASQLITSDSDVYVFLGKQSDRSCFAIEVPADEESTPERLSDLGQFSDIRKVGARIDSQKGELLIYARGIIYWHQSQRFCGVCGQKTTPKEGGHLRQCTSDTCSQQLFPRTDPAIIVLVTFGEKCLLARPPGWKTNGYATIAGFVEPGESLESAVVREVYEETGVRVASVTYHSSQPWPFPCSIMLGFTAVANGPDIRIDGQEIEDAKWFSHADIYEGIKSKKLLLPPRLSISYSLIAGWYDHRGPGTLADIIPIDYSW